MNHPECLIMRLCIQYPGLQISVQVYCIGVLYSVLYSVYCSVLCISVLYRSLIRYFGNKLPNGHRLLYICISIQFALTTRISRYDPPRSLYDCAFACVYLWNYITLSLSVEGYERLNHYETVIRSMPTFDELSSYLT